MIRQHKVFSFLVLMTTSPCGRHQKYDQRIGRARPASNSHSFFYETFSTNTLAAAEVDDVMVNYLNLGESQHDTITGVSWKNGVGEFSFIFLCHYHYAGYLLFINTFLLFCEDLRRWRLFSFLRKSQGFSLRSLWAFSHGHSARLDTEA
jgi:hypothetical protein